jgi:DNA recombination protein RmuC
MQRRLDGALEESARLTERARRVPSLEEEISSLQVNLREQTSRCSASTEQASRIPELETTCQKLADARTTLATEVAKLTTALAAERERNPEKLALLDEAKLKLSDAFKSLANDILEEKSSRFTEQNKTNISHILEPLNLKIEEFKTKVEQVYVQDSNDRTALKTQVTQLMSLSEKVSDDARNLADALKGSSKTQGNWGELILEHVLEASGLRKGHEYELRETYHYEDGTRGQPDVVILLPEDRQLVVDAKVSLTDYERYASTSVDTERQAALQSHVGSVRRHIKELSEKDYHTLYGLRSLDLVVMFVPLEPAFAAAIAADSSLWDEGLRRNVLLVSPSSLLFVLRTVAYLWRQEAQARNVQEIARCGADLYDKFVGFVEDLKGLGRQLQKAQLCYENASKKLSVGKGNLISRADKLKELGVAPKKVLPPELVEVALEEPITIYAAVDESVEPAENEGPSVPTPK